MCVRVNFGLIVGVATFGNKVALRLWKRHA